MCAKRSIAAMSIMLAICASGSGVVRAQDPQVVAEVIRRLTSPDQNESRTALSRIASDTTIADNPSIRASLLDLFQKAIERDRLEAAKQPPSANGERLPTAWRQYYEQLVRTVAALKEPLPLAMLARVDSALVVDPLVTVGPDAVRPILEALAAPTPPGFSREFKARLVRPLIVLSKFPLDFRGANERQITTATRQRLLQSTDPMELEALVRLADAIDDDVILRTISAFALSDTALTDRGITRPAEVSAIRDASKAVLSRRVVLP